MGHIILQHICYTKNKPFTLISIIQIMEKEYELYNKNDKWIYLKKGNQQITFEISTSTTKGVLWFIYFKRLKPETNDEISFANVTYNIARAHNLLSHMNKDIICRVCDHIG